MKVIDATNHVAGRLAAHVAKLLLGGESVTIINAEKAVISGNPDVTFVLYKEKRDRGDPNHGPFYPKQPDRILRRIIRGMVPYKKSLGRAAFKRLRVQTGTAADAKPTPIPLRDASKLCCKSITLGNLAERLGAKKNW